MKFTFRQASTLYRYTSPAVRNTLITETNNSKCCRYISSSSRLQDTNRPGGKIKWSYMHGESPYPLLGVTIGKLMLSVAEKHPDKDAHVFYPSNTRITFQQLLNQSDHLAAGLMKLGIKKGDRVGIWAPNIPEWVLTQYGTARAGIILVNINPAYQTNELEYALRKVGVKAIIMAETFKTQDYYKMLHSICPELDECHPGDLKSKELPDLKSVIMISDNDYNGTVKFSEVMDAGTREEITAIHNMQDKLQFDEPINIQFTSGTTGNPKGAALSHHNVVNNCTFVGHRLEYDFRDTRIAMPVPLYHCFGMVLGSMMSVRYGSTIVYPSPSFEAGPVLQAVETERCTSVYGTPTMFIDMLNHPDLHDFNLKSLNTGIMAGSPCPVEILKRVTTDLHMPEVTVCYGTTENSPVTFQGFMDDTIEKKTQTIGKPHPHTEAKVVDENGHVVPVGTLGELWIRGYCVMLNYWNDPDKTKESIGDDRWYKTGDLVYMDDEGYATIEGRIKDMIIRGGENIYPVELENFLYKHPKVEDVQVIGIPDDRLGEQVCACIKPHEGQTITPEEIKEFCNGELAHFKIPKYVVCVKEFPLTVTGKVQKYKMREQITKALAE